MRNDAISYTPASFRLRWDVFLSFRGEDTRHCITKSLNKSLYEHGIRVFRDDDGLNRGEEIAPSLIEAIYDSAASIVILSPNYGSSRWCLEELAKICELNRLILPIFYQVDPSHVRRQQGPFANDFKSHEERFGEEIVLKWRNAMRKVGGISGWVFKNSDEELLVQLLVKRVMAELSNTPIRVADYTVGLDSRVEQLLRLLDVKASGVLLLGLHGMGGVGKTTLAKAVYNKFVGQFQDRTFISNVREISGKVDGLISLQKKFIDDLSPDKKVLPSNEFKANIATIKGRVHDRKVIVVLDDVDDLSQLNAICGKKEWFGEGSRIIITTRDSVLLENCVKYEVQRLDSSQALQLFSYHALRREKPTDRFFNLSEQIVSLTGGLPLALEVFGAFLFDKRTIAEWKDAVEKLGKIRPDKLQGVLKISFDGLDEQDKCIFLDIACLFVKTEMKREDAIDILKGCGFRAEIAITVLIAKSLIKITEDDTLWMHDQLRDMGRQIVQQENILDAGQRSRLWDHDEIISVLKQQKGTRSIQGIVLDFNERSVKKKNSIAEMNFPDGHGRRLSLIPAVTHLKEKYKQYVQRRLENERETVLCTKSFESIISLRLLQINHGKLEGKFKFLPAELKWLQWKKCPFETLPSDFCPSQLAVLDLSESGIEHVWGSYTNKVAKNLMVMNLHGCWNLAAIPDLSEHRILEKLVLEGCKRLTKIHESVGNISTLLNLNLRACSSLIEFPSDVTGLKHLENLILSGCSKLKELPEGLGNMRSLKELLVDGTAIEKLPDSIFHLVKLEKLNLDNCRLLKQLPECIGKLDALKELSLNHSGMEELPDSVGCLRNLEKLTLIGCRSVNAIPGSIGNLKSLIEFLIDETAVQELPPSIGSLSYLKAFSVRKCTLLGNLPESIEGLASLLELRLDGTSIKDLPDQIGGLKMLDKLEMRTCRSLTCLPLSIGSMMSLTILIIFEANITELPESIGMLENLIILRLNKCKQLKKLPASIGKLKSLVHLLMEETAMTELPESFGMLSSLMVLRMAKRSPFKMPEAIEPMTSNIVLPKSFSNLSLLEELDARSWRICGKIPDDFEKLSCLEILNLGSNNFFSLPSSLRGLSLLKRLLLPHCEELKTLPPLPSSLEEVNLANCYELESIYDLSNLESLKFLNVTNCEKVMDIPGLECLKSLRWLYMSGCKACSSAVKRRLSKVHLKKLHNLSMPGSKIPEWFSPDMVRFSEHKNLKIKGVIIGVVISLDHQTPDDLRYQLPGVVDILATITSQNKTIFNTALDIKGVPKTNEDQVHLCRYTVYNDPLVLMLKDGCKIQVSKRNPPLVKGVQLKKCGICLVYENDDDYDGDEKTLDESQLSVSEKLANFFASFEEDDQISESGHEVEQEMQEFQAKEGTSTNSSNNCSNFTCVFIILSVSILLISFIYCFVGIPS